MDEESVNLKDGLENSSITSHKSGIQHENMDSTTEISNVDQNMPVSEPYQETNSIFDIENCQVIDISDLGSHFLEETIMIDTSNPIYLSNNSIINVEGKKCVLYFAEDLQKMIAYPIISKPKRRGRPRKILEDSKVEDKSEFSSPTIDESNAISDENVIVDGMIRTVTDDGMSVIRSSRKRKKARILNDYETGKLKSVVSDLDDSDEDFVMDDSQELVDTNKEYGKQKRILKPKNKTNYSHGSINLSFLQPLKKARGRPKRYGIKQTAFKQFKINLGNDKHITVQIPECNIPKEMSSQEIADQLTANLSKNPKETLQALSSMIVLPEKINPPIIKPALKDCDDSLKPDQIEAYAEVTNKENDQLELYPSADLSSSDIHFEEIGSEPMSSKAVVVPVSKKLLIELQSDNLTQYSCEKCGSEFETGDRYEDHLLNEHPDHLCMCNACDMFSLKKSFLLQHFKSQHPDLICKFCEHMSENSASAERHISTVHESNTPTCGICHKVYKNQNVLKMHVKLVHLPALILYECNVCSKKFNRKAHLKRHLRIHDPEKSYKCSLCDYRAVEKSDVNKHMVVHEEPKEICCICGHAFRHPRNLTLHMKRHLQQKDYKCGICSYYGYTFTEIRKHIERRHKDSKTLLCNNCGLAFDEQKLKEHQENGNCKEYAIEQLVEEESVEQSNLINTRSASEIESAIVKVNEELTEQPKNQAFQIILDNSDNSMKDFSTEQIVLSTSDNMVEKLFNSCTVMSSVTAKFEP